MSEAMNTAKIILDQLGGRVFTSFTGAKNFTALNEERGGLMFSLPGKSGFVKNKINKVRIILNWNDTYTIEFGRVVKYDYKVVNSISNVYCDMLVHIFEEETGLVTSF